MKKILAVLLALLLSLSVLSACGGGLEDPPPLPPPREKGDSPSSPVIDPPPPTQPDTNNPSPGDPDSDALGLVIPGVGGVFNVEPPTEFIFIPDQSGVWEFRTSNNDGDPYLELFGGEYGGLIWEDDDSGGSSNALITWVLRAGAEYRLIARNWSSHDTDGFTLTVQQLNPIAISGDGASVQVDGTTFFVFIPNSSGMWEFRTSDNGGSDPKLHIYDADGVELYDDDDSGGDSNALINARLESGTTYYVRATFFWGDEGRYSLTVTLK